MQNSIVKVSKCFNIFYTIFTQVLDKIEKFEFPRNAQCLLSASLKSTWPSTDMVPSFYGPCEKPDLSILQKVWEVTQARTWCLHFTVLTRDRTSLSCKRCGKLHKHGHGAFILRSLQETGPLYLAKGVGSYTSTDMVPSFTVLVRNQTSLSCIRCGKLQNAQHNDGHMS